MISPNSLIPAIATFPALGGGGLDDVQLGSDTVEGDGTPDRLGVDIVTIIWVVDDLDGVVDPPSAGEVADFGKH
jgi:hypothetical protein